MRKRYLIPATFAFILLAIIYRQTALPPVVTRKQKNLAIRTIKDYSAVKDAAVVQEGRNLDLSITVDYATPEENARELGNNFVRLIQTLGPEAMPGAVVGKGMFNYLVGVYYPSGEMLAMGTKPRTSDHITW